MSETRLREVTRPNYREEEDSPPKQKKSKNTSKTDIGGKPAMQRSGAVSRVNFCVPENSTPKRNKLENTAKNKREKIATQRSNANGNDTTATVVATNCLLINRFVEVNKDWQKMQNLLYEEKIKNTSLSTEMAEKDKQILSLQQQLKAFKEDLICDDLISFESGGRFIIHRSPNFF